MSVTADLATARDLLAAIANSERYAMLTAPIDVAKRHAVNVEHLRNAMHALKMVMMVGTEDKSSTTTRASAQKE